MLWPNLSRLLQFCQTARKKSPALFAHFPAVGPSAQGEAGTFVDTFKLNEDLLVMELESRRGDGLP